MSAKRILVADDERSVAISIRHMLEIYGYEIEEVYQGSEVLRRISESSFDLLLLDFDMRDIKGDRICLLMREDDKLRALPVIIITAHIEVDERIFKEYGADAVLYKPVESEDLIRAVKKCLKET